MKGKPKLHKYMGGGNQRRSCCGIAAGSALVKAPRFCIDFAGSLKLNSHKNLCKPVNLDQIGFDLSDKEISAPDRRFVIDSVLGRGALSPAGYGPGTIACETQEHGRLL